MGGINGGILRRIPWKVSVRVPGEISERMHEKLAKAIIAEMSKKKKRNENLKEISVRNHGLIS